MVVGLGLAVWRDEALAGRSGPGRRAERSDPEVLADAVVSTSSS